MLIREIHLGIKNLMMHGLRSLLTILGMVFGVGSVVAMLAVGEGASHQAMEQVKMLGSNNIIINSINPAETAIAQEQLVNVYGLLAKDEKRIRQSFETVVRTVPVRLQREVGRVGSRSLELRLVGTTPDWVHVVKRPLLKGRFLLPRDLEGNNNVVVLTEYAARRMLAGGESIGEKVRIDGKLFTIVGIVKSHLSLSEGIQFPDRREDAYIPLTTLRQRFGDIITRRSSGTSERNLVELHQILVEVNQADRVESTAHAIKTMLTTFHERVDYQLQVPLTLLREAKRTKRTFNVVLGSIAAISLLVGGIGIMNIMLANVTERTREIGIRRAIGAKRRQILRQFVIETVVLSMLGGLLGIGLGLFIPWLVTRYSGLPTLVTPASIALSLFISMTIGIIFGIYPAKRAAQLDPIEALRHD